MYIRTWQADYSIIPLKLQFDMSCHHDNEAAIIENFIEEHDENNFEKLFKK